MIFDPNNSAAGNLPELLDTTVVDGAFILKPYAELTAPVASLDDLEPTELDGTPAYTDAIVAESLHEQSTVSAPVVWVGQIVEPVNDVVTAFADDVVDEVADEVAIAVVDEAITEVVDEVATVVVDEVVTEVVDEVVAEVVDEAVAEVVDEVVTEVVDEVATVVVDEFAVEVVDEGVTEIVDDFVTESVADVETESVDEPHEFVNDFVQPIIDTVAHDVDEPSGVSTFTVEQELQLAAPVEMLDGFTADEAPPAAGAIVITEDVGLVVANVTYNVVHTPEADVLPSLDFDAMLELAPTDVPLVFDLQTDEFALACDELAATHVVRDEDESTARLVDAFESSAQLPPLIFPMPLDYVATGDTHTPELVDAATNLVFLDIQDVDVDVAPPRFTPIELDAVEARRNADDVAFDLLNETDDLDDLFGDTDVPTAIIAAEATLVASSRCSELRAASDAEPDNFGLRRRLGEALLEAGNRSEAITELGAALAGAELAELLTDAADIADELVHVAGEELAHHQKRLELAIRLEDETRLRDAYLDLADNLVRRGEDLRARAVYARVLEIDPWDERARTALGDAAPPAPSKPPVAGSDDGHVSLADWLRDDDEPVSTRLRIREPDISGDEQDDFNALLKHFKEGVARSLGEDDYESHYDLGVAYKEMGLLDDAIGEFQMALRSRSNRLAAYEALGQCFIEQRSYKVAVTVLSRALHEPAMQDEQRVGVLYLLGISCEELQRFDEARGYFQRVYATDIHFRDVNQRLADLERTVR